MRLEVGEFYRVAYNNKKDLFFKVLSIEDEIEGNWYTIRLLDGSNNKTSVPFDVVDKLNIRISSKSEVLLEALDE